MLQSLYASALQKTKDFEVKVEDQAGQIQSLTSQVASKSEQVATF
jgi:predicted ATP-binding protein involved in virulence